MSQCNTRRASPVDPLLERSTFKTIEYMGPRHSNGCPGAPGGPSGRRGAGARHRPNVNRMSSRQHLTLRGRRLVFAAACLQLGLTGDGAAPPLRPGGDTMEKTIPPGEINGNPSPLLL